MYKNLRSLSAVVLASAMLGGCASDHVEGTIASTPPPAPPAAVVMVEQATPLIPAKDPRGGQLFATAWVRTSAEYEALCRQVYRQAGDRVEELAQEARATNGAKPLAVVLDLDETVFDNSGYQLWLAQNNITFTEDSFHEWVSAHVDQIKAVPGAVEFIAKCEANKVTPIYISNRGDVVNDATVRTLKHLGISTANIQPRLMLKTDTSSKEARRQEAMKNYHVIAYVGDNLDDFSDAFRDSIKSKDIDQRMKAVDAHKQHWGNDWFVLPNPMYGTWERLVTFENYENDFRASSPAGAVR